MANDVLHGMGWNGIHGWLGDAYRLLVPYIQSEFLHFPIRAHYRWSSYIFCSRIQR